MSSTRISSLDKPCPKSSHSKKTYSKKFISNILFMPTNVTNTLSTLEFQKIMNERRKSLELLNSDRKFALFLDRDGVINRRIVGGYVTRPAEFEFLPGALEAMSIFSKLFYPIIVVTNQQGIGKGKMTEEQLNEIHSFMKEEIRKAGGEIHAIYHCPDLKVSHSTCRKPRPGMALRARHDFPALNFKHSMMVGDMISDMVFGHNLGMITVLIADEQLARKHPMLIDYRFNSLYDFAMIISKFDVQEPPKK